MQQLWTPWRSQYIESFSDELATKNECFLCSAFENNESDSELLVVARREHCFVVMNRYPYNAGHIMVAPNRHVGDITLLSEDELVEIMFMIQEAAGVLKSVFNPHGINIGANIGRSAGAGVPDHIHFHLVPRWEGDTNFMPILADAKVISASLSETQKLLSAAFDGN